VEEWWKAAAQHNPGKPDSAAMMIGRWDERDLELVIQFVTKLAAQPVKTARRTLARASIRRILQLTDQEVKHGNLNRILKQGALLHTDIALLGMETKENINTSEPVAVFYDGRVAVVPKERHWKFARRLIDTVSPSPSEDPMVRQWYIATTAHMQSHRLFAYAKQNLENALEIFPSDDRILFYAGVLHETWASPLNQNILLPPRVQVTFGSKESELKRARSFFQKSIEANPNSAETHLRLGRVLGLLGNHRQAAAELEQAVASIKDPQLLYYASLYLGYEFEMLSLRSEAREQYERAAMLYPAAQSPLLALSQLAHSSDDVKGALLALQRVYELPRADLWKDDPWWAYDLSHVRDADELVAEMHKVFGGLPR
jgi:tetratricopeptide (TPR) repeat protein